MPSLVCSVQNCVYNNAMYCSRGDIKVGGSEAETCQETCCDSFQERKAESMKSSVGTPSQEIGVVCEACHCGYNEDCKCTAGQIDIAGAAACRCGETECATFTKE
ncbi:MAG: DUF1540 domain-containing protein [Lachnospiraceae bacterium]|nr:DUF1540 domain-containing protein [Lachnospiraceae bacterium]MDD3796540.1 DUF1540 domain-containing protein [Lachnospiraceae bacterium]